MTREPTPPSWMPTGGEMSGRVAAFDWSATSLGPLGSWPLSLRNAVSTCLASNFPILVLWGPELIKIYNDGYASMIGSEKHPSALGRPAVEVWPEIWDTIGPMFDSVMTTGAATWSQNERLMINRHGYPEECYFSFSYSPVYGDDGGIEGVLDISIETTSSVVNQRRLACIADLNVRLAPIDIPTRTCVEAVGVLGRYRSDIIAVDVLLQIEDDLVTVASNRRFQLERLRTEELVPVLEAGTPKVFGHRADGRARHYVIPFGPSREQSTGLVTLSLNQHLPFDDDYRRFAEVIAQTIGVAVDRTQRRSDAVGQLQHVNETLQRAMLPDVVENEAFAARYLPAANHLSVGGDWYDIVELPDDRRAMVVGDCVGHDLDAATAMGQLRSASRALLLEANDPASTVSGLDSFAESIEGGKCASVVCLVVDHRAQTVTYCRAGHPPPLMIGADGTRWFDELGGPLLGITPDVERHNVTVPFTPGDILVMYTDGLVERRDRPATDQIDRMVDWLTNADRSDLRGVVDGLLTELLPDSPDDDVVLVVKALGATSAHVGGS